MRRILLCGATHGSNFGDSLFAYMFKSSIENLNKDIEILFTRTSQYSKGKLGLKEATYKEILSSDGMIYISGGYFGQSHNETFKESIYRYLLYFRYGLIMILRRKPIAVIGVGAGPLNRWFLRKIAVLIFKKSKTVSVRDMVSREYMINYGVKKNIIVTSDSAQAITSKRFDINIAKPMVLSDNKVKGRKIILVHITDTTGKDLYHEYVIEALKETLFSCKEISYIITQDTTRISHVLEETYSMFPKDRTVIYEYDNPQEFVQLISSIDAVITPKLHVGIIGCTYGKPVLSFPVHPGKTKRYYEQIGHPEHCKSLYDISKEEVKKMIKNYIDKNIELPDNIRNSALSNFDLLHEFIYNHINTQ